MTSLELQQKLNDANMKVEKRIETINKLCKKININSDELLKAYNEVASANEKDWLSSKVADEIVSKFFTRIERDYDRNYTDEEYNQMYDNHTKFDQLSDNLPKLYEVERVAKNWQVKYDTQKNKEEAPKIKVLWDFLTNWEEKAIAWYKNECESYFNLQKNFIQAKEDYQHSEKLAKQLESITSSEYQMRYYRTVERAIDYLVREWEKNYYSGITSLTKEIIDIDYEVVYRDERHWDYDYSPISYTIDEEKLAKIIAQEKQAKYEDLCNRISAVVGEIVDCKNLHIGNQNGELNGTVIGTKANARVETIGAGGYNVGQVVNVKCGQCFHYRVLVHKC